MLTSEFKSCWYVNLVTVSESQASCLSCFQFYIYSAEKLQEQLPPSVPELMSVLNCFQTTPSLPGRMTIII